MLPGGVGHGMHATKSACIYKKSKFNKTSLNRGTAAIPLFCFSHEKVATSFYPFSDRLTQHTNIKIHMHKQAQAAHKCMHVHKKKTYC